jgi:fructan beta-fructosidase
MAVLMLTAGLVCMLGLNSAGAPAHLDEPKDLYRPVYHFTPPKNWMNDPNGLVYFDGEYHLFYQYNPHGITWGHMSWGHAISKDMVTWEHLPVAIPEADGIMAFSGSAVHDAANTSGLGENGKGPLVAIYTGHRPADGRQNQWIASSNDRGRTWKKLEGNPVLEIGSNNFRDPKVWWHEPSKCWMMVISLSEERKVQFYKSPDLKAWTHLSDFGGAGSTHGIWECPDMFELPIDGRPGEEPSGERRWVLIVNIGWAGPQGGNGCQYFVGSFDGTKFTVDPTWKSELPMWLDHGRDFYATVTWSGVPALPGKSEGRRVALGWMVNGEYSSVTPTWPWRSAMTIPRELSLKKTEEGLRVFQQPVRELEKARGKVVDLGSGTVAEVSERIAKAGLKGNALEIRARFKTNGATRSGVRVHVGDGEFTEIGYDRGRKAGYIDRRSSGNTSFHHAFAGVHEARLFETGDVVEMHIFVDSCSVEAFFNGGEKVITDLVYPNAREGRIEVFESGGKAEIESLSVCEITPGN